jgi:hypothetical protein
MSLDKSTEVWHVQAAAEEAKIKSETDTPQAIQSAINVFAYAAGSRETTATKNQVEELLSKHDPSSWVIMQKLLTTKESWEAVMTGIKKVNSEILQNTQSFIAFLERLPTTSEEQPAMSHIKNSFS